ncbi:MAG: hypothetical protein DHS20C09_21370 [marine bacterium B5-7]|nr:MAG: hypothetical protein DHS20C09_21370 [marine bacterium B5-7]
MKLKTLLTTLMASALFFTFQASADGSGSSRCHQAQHELIDAERALRELENRPHSFRDYMNAELRVHDAEIFVALACEASTIGEQ